MDLFLKAFLCLSLALSVVQIALNPMTASPLFASVMQRTNVVKTSYAQQGSKKRSVAYQEPMNLKAWLGKKWTQSIDLKTPSTKIPSKSNAHQNSLMTDSARIGSMLTTVSSILGMVCTIWLIVLCSSEGFLWVFGTIAFPPVGTIFCLCHFELARNLVLVTLSLVALRFIGFYLIAPDQAFYMSFGFSLPEA